MEDKIITLSICIPTYNRAGLLCKTMEAFVPQTRDKTVEIVISDNASNDNTQSMVAALQKQWSVIKYFRNQENIGLDLNALTCVQRARGTYCWLCSDDDIPLPGTVERILVAIKRYSPPFLYLHFAGFVENEPYDIVLRRERDKEDVVYNDPELMIRQLLLNHFSATIAKRELFLKYSWVIDKYKVLNPECGRGYFSAINYYLVMNNLGPYVYIGKLSLAVRNPISITGNSYNPLTIIIDNARHFQNMRKEGLISRQTEEYVLNQFLRGFYRLVLPMKCCSHPLYTQEVEARIYKYCAQYKNFWLYLYPTLVLPRWLLIFPTWVGKKIKKVLRKALKRSPFD